MAVAPTFESLGKILVRLAPIATAYWASRGGDNAFQATYNASDSFTICKATTSFRRWSGAALEEDLAQFSMYHLNFTDGTVDSSWTEEDFTALADRYATFYGALRAQQDNYTVIDSLKLHLFRVGQPPGPFVKNYNQGTLSGTKSGGALPPQCACSVTLVTAHRKHWGRVYVPGLTTDSIDLWGRMGQTDVDLMQDVFANFVNTMAGIDFPVVVYSPASASLLNVIGVRVDDVVDTIRRRRWKHAAYHKIWP